MALPGRGQGGGRGGGATLFYSGVPGGPDSHLGTKFYALKYKNELKIKIRKKSGRKKFQKTVNLGKKELAATPYHRIHNFFNFFPLGTKFYA